MGIWPKKTSAWWEKLGPIQASPLLARSAARRASLLTRYSAFVMSELVGHSFENHLKTPIVFGSTLGSISVLFQLLEQMSLDDSGLSPIRFSGSVHHASVSAIGVSAKHTGMVTALSANEDLVAMALIEALSIANVEGNALLVVGDEKWPDDFSEPDFDTYAGGVFLAPDEDRTLRIQTSNEEFSSVLLPEELRANPSAPLQLFIEWCDDAKHGDALAIGPRQGGGSWIATCST